MNQSYRIAVALILVFGSWILDPPPILADESSFTITVENQTVSVDAKNASALAVLKDLAEKASIEIRIFKGVQDKTVNLTLKDHLLSEMPELLQNIGVNFVYGYEIDPSKNVVYVLPEGKESKVLAMKSRHKIFISPGRKYMATINSYTLPNGTTPEGKSKDKWERRLVFYDPVGNVRREEVWDTQKELYKSGGLFLYPRNNGTMVMIWPKEAEFERRGADRELLKKDQLSSWVNTHYSAEFPGPPNVDENTLPNWNLPLICLNSTCAI